MSDYDYIDTFENWNDPLASNGPCPWGGLGNYVLLDSMCEWRCPYRKSCKAIKEKGVEK